MPDKPKEFLHIKPMPDTTACEIHSWSNEKMEAEFLPLLRERHGKGGLNACVECIKKAKEKMDARRK